MPTGYGDMLKKKSGEKKKKKKKPANKAKSLRMNAVKKAMGKTSKAY
tara:strand:+ start:871 stop:1011 length:141 start_codon:yes stop_codon:yes gene_type:complete